MGKVIFHMAMSLDGFVAASNGDESSLHLNLGDEPYGLLQDMIKTTGAVVMGKRAFEMAEPDWYVDNYEYQVPIFVVTHTAPEKQPKQDDHLSFTFVTTGLANAIQQAKQAAADQQVTVIGGANIAQQGIRSRLFDEIIVSVAPVLLGEGLRLFDHLGGKPIVLQRVKVIESAARTDLWFRLPPGPEL